MVTSSVLLIFLGSFALYSTSKEPVLRKNLFIEKWLQTYTTLSKTIGLLLLITALIFIVDAFGNTAGFLLWLLSAISMLSLIILLYPLNNIKHNHIVIIFVFLLISELIVLKY